MARLTQSLMGNSIFIAIVAGELSRTPMRPLTHKKTAQHLAMRVFEIGLTKQSLPLFNDLGDLTSNRSRYIFYSFEMNSHSFFVAICV